MLKELIELLVEGKNQEFQERFQSFIDQIPKSKDASSAPAKREFFPGLFLGMFANLKDTELYSELGINEISFKLDSMNNLHVVVNYKKPLKQQIFVFTNNEKTNLEKTSKSYRNKYAGGVCIVNVHKGEVTLKGSPSNNNYQVGDEFIKINRIEQSSSRKNLENSMSDILSINERLEDRRKLDLVDSVLKYHTDLYQKIGNLLPSEKRNFFNAEALQHGFLTGGLMNFRYRDNIKTNIELVLGQGYADMMLLVRGKDRSQSAIPIIIELKKSSDSNALVKAREEAEWYAKGLHSNKMRIITDSQNVICVGLDLNGGGVSSSVRTIDTPKEPFLQALLGLVYNNKSKEIKNLLSEIHYSFPRTGSLYDYLNQFLLGQSLIISQANIKDIESKGVFKHKNSSYLTSFVFQVGDKLLVLNIDSRAQVSTRQASAQGRNALPLDQIRKHGTQVENIIEVNISTAYGSKLDFSPGKHFHKEGTVTIQSSSFRDYSRINKAEGYFYQINSNVNNLKAKFNGAVDHQHNILGDSIGENLSGVQENAAGIEKYRELSNSISEEVYNHRGYFSDALKAELSYKAFLDGILTGLSDIRSDNLKVIVLTEFQVGKGKRVDIAIQTIGKNGKQGTPILIELKTNPSTKEFSLAQEQLAKYLESPNIKTITDGKQAAGFIAALNTKGTSVETMIRISDKLAVATIQHSSIIAPSSSHRAKKICFKSAASRGKREISGSNCILSSLTEEDIEKVSKGKGVVLNGEDIEIDRKNFEIDNKKLIERAKLLRDSDDILKYEDLMNLSDSEKVTGPFGKQVKTLSNTQKVASRLGTTTHIGNYVILNKDLLSHIANSDYEQVAITGAMIGGQIALDKLSQRIATQGINLIKSGNKIVGTSLRVAAPVVPNLISLPLSIKGLVDSVDGCEKICDDVDTLCKIEKDRSCTGIIENSLYIGESVATTGIAIGAATGAIASGGAVATLAFPVGAAVVLVTAVGSQIYTSVHRVDEIDKVIPLTKGEKWEEGWRAFTFRETSTYLVKLIKEKEFNNRAVNDSIEWLKINKEFEVMVFPSIDAHLQTIEGVTGYTPEVKQDNEISFGEKVKVTWSRSAPDELIKGRVISAPEGELGRVIDDGYRSKDTIAIQYSNNRTGNDALFKLLDGNDKVTGFPERKNVFLIGNDYKLMTGGNKDDQFVLRGNQTKGELSGLQGSDTVFTNYFASNNSPLFVTFNRDKSRVLHDNAATCRRYGVSGIRVALPDPQLNIQVNDINQFYGRSNKVDYVSITCDSGINFVDLLGTDDTLQGVICPSSLGNIYETNDRIYIEQNKETNCSYDMNLAIHSSTIVENRGSNGSFTYKVKPGKGSATLSLNGLSTHKLLFEEVKLSDIRRINISKENNLHQISLVFNIHNHSKRDANTGLVITQNKHKDFQLHINSKELFNLNLELSDGTLIDLVEKRIYFIKPLEELGESTSTLVDLSTIAKNIARRLGFAISARSDSLKTHLSIGNGESNLMYNNVKGYTSYLVGNRGNDTYVITSGYNKLDNNTEIPDVVISDIDINKNDIATLVLSGVMGQIRNDLNIKVKSVIQRDNNDLLIVLKSDEKDLLEVRLLNALNNDVYKKYEVILNDLRMKISKSSSDYVFEILPIAYDSTSALQNIKKVYSEDIENIKELKILDRNMDDYTFIREEDSLVISNIFSRDEKQYGIILVDFFLEDQFKDLSIEFKDDKKISLKDHLGDIYNAQDIDKIKAQYDERIYASIDLHSAIKKNDLNEIVSLLEQGASFDLKDDYGKTALDVARETILDSSGKIQSDILGRKLIHLASESGNVKAIEYLLNKGEDVNVIENNGWTPLHYATKEGNLEAVKYLVDEKKAGFYSTKYETNDGKSAVHIASFYGKKDVVNFLITKEGVGADWKDGYYRFVFFGHQGDSFTPLHWAVKGGHLDLMNHLINLGSNIYAKDYNGRTPINIAKEEGHADIVKRLEEVMRGYENGKRAIHFAAENNDVEALQYRVNQGDDVNERAPDGWRPVHSASESGSLEALKILIDKGAGFDTYWCRTVIEGKAPIHIAAHNGHTDIVKYFIIDKKVPVDWPDGYRCGFMWVNICGDQLSSLHWAAKGGHLDTVISLIDMGADVHAVDFYKKKPLHYAAESSSLEIIKILLDAGANVHAIDSNKKKPLHYAAQSGSLEIVKLLIIAGANPQAVDHNGKTPSDLAKEKGHTNIVSHLESLNRNRRSIESSQRDKHSVEENKKSSIEELSYLKLDNEKTVTGKAIDNKSTIHNNKLETENFNFDFNGALLLSTLLSKLPIVGKFFPKIKLPDTNSTTFTSISLPESMAYAADITQECEKILNKTATHLSISKESLNLNPVLLSSEIAHLFRNGSKTSELSKVLYSYAKEISRDNNEFLNLIKAELPNLEKTYELKLNNLQANITSLSINNIVPNNITTSSEKEIKYLPSSSMSNVNTLAVANNSMTR